MQMCSDKRILVVFFSMDVTLLVSLRHDDRMANHNSRGGCGSDWCDDFSIRYAELRRNDHNVRGSHRTSGGSDNSDLYTAPIWRRHHSVGNQCNKEQKLCYSFDIIIILRFSDRMAREMKIAQRWWLTRGPSVQLMSYRR